MNFEERTFFPKWKTDRMHFYFLNTCYCYSKKKKKERKKGNERWGLIFTLMPMKFITDFVTQFNEIEKLRSFTPYVRCVLDALRPVEKWLLNANRTILKIMNISFIACLSISIFLQPRNITNLINTHTHTHTHTHVHNHHHHHHHHPQTHKHTHTQSASSSSSRH